MAGKRTKLSYEVTEQIAGRGFPREFAEIVGQELNTDFTARQMLGYLRQANPQTMEAIADEMLGILEFRNRCVQKHIMKGRSRKPVNELYLRSVSVRWTRALRESYLAEIPALRSLDTLEFRKNITFFCGENGSGKSTLLEGIAVAAGLNPEGGTQNYAFHTYDDYSELGKDLKLVRGTRRPKWSYFLRAESFFNAATALNTRYNDDGQMPDYHALSHGESFLEFIQSAESEGLYLMDEPEAALSPSRQLTLLIHLVQMAKEGSQFIIATHSPILLGTPGAEILTFDASGIHPVEYEEADCVRTTRLFLENRERMLQQLLRED